MAAHARLKNECTEDEKYHNLMSWLKWAGERQNLQYKMALAQSDQNRCQVLFGQPWTNYFFRAPAKTQIRLQMPRWVFTERTSFVGFAMHQLK